MRGPTSALSSFLAEYGIVAPHAASMYRRASQPTHTAQTPPNGVSSPVPAAEATSPPTPNYSGPRVVYREVSDDDDDAASTPSRGGRKSGSGRSKKSDGGKGEEKAKKAAKKAAKKRKKSGKGSDDDGSDYSASSDSPDEGFRRPRRRIAMCGRCGTPFENNMLRCAVCASSAAEGNGRSPARPKRKGPEGSILGDVRGVNLRIARSLQEICVQTISRHIGEIPSLGDVPPETLVSICDLTCRLRYLNKDTLRLFLQDDMEMLRIIDCAALDGKALAQITGAGATLTYLELGNCGRMTGDVLHSVLSAMPELTDLALSGLFLPGDDQLAAAVALLPQLRRLRIADSPYVGAATLGYLAANAADRLTSLKLPACEGVKEVNMGDIAQLGLLVELSLERCSSLTDAAMARLFATPFDALQVLDISGCDLLTGDGWTLSGMPLRKLYMGSLPLLEDERIADILGGIDALEELDLGGCVLLSDASVAQVVGANAKSLRSLRLNKVMHAGEGALEAILSCARLEHLDVSWVRAVDGPFLERLIEAATALKAVRIWGDNLVSEFAVRACEKRGVVVTGFEGSY